MERELSAVELRQSAAGRNPDASVCCLGDADAVLGSEAVAIGEALDLSVGQNAPDARIGGHPDVAIPITADGAHAVARQAVSNGEE